MNLLELGQLFFTGISGTSLKEEERDFIQEANIGGIILFKHNYNSPAQLAELVNEIQVLRDEYPLFISVDQEGGRVKRFQTQFAQFPSMYEVASHDSPKLSFEVHKIMAEELKACGINLSYSPCCDIWTNDKNKVIGDRSFGKTPEIVEKHVSAAIRGLHTGGVLACAKHFPGHGDTTKDSHFDLPYVLKNLEELKKDELIPFVKASQARVEFMMMAHLIVDAIDTELPCTLSGKAYDFLRDELKYKKIVITDDMEMKAISDRYTYTQAGMMALNAGADVLLYRSFEKTKEVYEGVLENLKNKKIKYSVIDEKISRVMDCKKRFLSEYRPIYIPSLMKVFNREKTQQVLEQIGSKS